MTAWLHSVKHLVHVCLQGEGEGPGLAGGAHRGPGALPPQPGGVQRGGGAGEHAHTDLPSQHQGGASSVSDPLLFLVTNVTLFLQATGKINSPCRAGIIFIYIYFCSTLSHVVVFSFTGIMYRY